MDLMGESEMAGLTIFRADDGATLEETEIMRTEPISEASMAGIREWMAAGDIDQGRETRMLFVSPGMSLMYIWFKSGWLLPRHSHDVDCLYFVLAGSLQIGTEELKSGDGFFVGAEIPYAYVAGPTGVEVLEFRAGSDFNLRLLAENPAFWTRAANTLREKSVVWPTEGRPSAVLHET